MKDVSATAKVSSSQNADFTLYSSIMSTKKKKEAKSITTNKVQQQEEENSALNDVRIVLNSSFFLKNFLIFFTSRINF